MKLLYTILIFSTAALVVFFLPSQKNSLPKETGGEENPLEKEKWQHDRLVDPATGKIPSMALWNAYQQLVAEGKMKPGPFVNQATLRTEQWQLVNDFFASLAISKLVYDPNNTQKFYFCTGEGWYNADASIGAGVFKSDDGGNTWNQMPSTANVNFNYCFDIDIHLDSADVTSIYVGTTTGLWRSKDDGLTWKRVLVPPGSVNHSVCDVEFTKNGSIFATSGAFITGAIYHSESGDSGTWGKQTAGFPTSGIYRVELATAPTNDDVAYAVACQSSDYTIKDIYRTSNQGQLWEPLNYADTGSESFAHEQAWYDLILAVDPNDENIVAAGGWHWFRTKDGGATWLRLNHGRPDSMVNGSPAYQYAHVDEHAIVFRNSDTVYFGCDGGVYKCTNFTAPQPILYERNYGYRVTQYYAADINQQAGSLAVIGGTQDNGTNKLIFSGVSPEQNLTGYDGAFCAINPQNPDIIYTTKNSNGVFRFTNGGLPPADTITNPYITDNDVEFINPIALDPADAEILYQPTSKGLYRLSHASTAIDSDWVKASKPLTAVSFIAVSTNAAHVVYAGRTTGGNVYRLDHADTSTAAHAWVNCDPQDKLPNGSAVSCSCILVDPNDENHIFVTFSNYVIKNIWETKNASDAIPVWVSHDGDLPSLPVNAIFIHPTHPEVAYIATDLGIFYTTELNGDSTVWLPSNTGIANVRVSTFTYRPSDHTLLAATFGRGMFTTTVPMDGPDFSITWTERGPLDVGGRTRAIMIDPNDPTGQTIWAGAVSGGLWKTTHIDGLPAVGIAAATHVDFDLNVFPNPVADAGTEFQFTLSQTENVTLTIYDGSGRTVDVVWKGNAAAGIHNLHWNAGNRKGIFYLSLTDGQKQLVKKIVCL